MKDFRLKLEAVLNSKTFYCLLFFITIAASLGLTANNLLNYNSWWSDDGGAHLAYGQIISEQWRLPTAAETYLFWHEPLYYIVEAVWTGFGDRLGFGNLNWQEALNYIVFYFFLFIVWQLTYTYTKKNKWLALAGLFIAAFMFTGVKLSAYVNNELPVQLLMLLLVLLFIRLKLDKPGKIGGAVVWSFVLAIALLVKLTAFIILLSAAIIWLCLVLVKRDKSYLLYLFFAIFISGIINAPWLAYKQDNFGAMFSINIYEQENRQDLLASEGWNYLTAVNWRIFRDQPYWQTQPDSFSSIVIADAFGDYYNLFNNVDRLDGLPAAEKMITGNGRFITADLFVANLWANRIGLLIFFIWLVGFCGQIISDLRKKQINWPRALMIVIFCGSWLALIYNNLSFPYLERGTLKAAFIFSSFILMALIANYWYWQVIKNKIIWTLICLLPFILYLLFAWRILLIKPL